MKLQKTAITIRPIAPGGELPMALLLLADPSRKVVESYIYQSRVYVAENDNGIIGVYAVTNEESGAPEIRNLAVAEAFQGQGLGALLLSHAIERARENQATKLIIGTANASVGQLYLYQKMGFEIMSLKKGFFLEHYDEPIFENGIQCRDMIVLEYRFA